MTGAFRSAGRFGASVLVASPRACASLAGKLISLERSTLSFSLFPGMNISNALEKKRAARRETHRSALCPQRGDAAVDGSEGRFRPAMPEKRCAERLVPKAQCLSRQATSDDRELRTSRSVAFF